MANQWLRLWHDMPTDPKWRTVAKISGQRIGDVMAVYMHLLVCASNATERGRTQSFNCEDVATSLDIETEQVAAIVDAMQGRVLDGESVKGWAKRQVDRDDGAAERARAWREQKKAEKAAEAEALNATERNRTQAERKQTPDKDKEEIREEEKEQKTSAPAGSVQPAPAKPEGRFPEFWATWPKTDRRQDRKRCLEKWAAKRLDAIADEVIDHVDALKRTRKWIEGFEPAPLTYLNGERWKDGVGDERPPPPLAEPAWKRQARDTANAWSGGLAGAPAPGHTTDFIDMEPAYANPSLPAVR